MCGIVGYLNKKRGVDTAIVERMVQIRHRGPDDSGVCLNTAEDLVMTHRRFSIIDLTPAGHHPMESFSERYVPKTELP